MLEQGGSFHFLDKSVIFQFGEAFFVQPETRNFPEQVFAALLAIDHDQQGRKREAS